MGNSSSRRRLKDYSISPGEDAVQALITSTSVSSSLQDNTIFLNESFFSLDPSMTHACEMDENNHDPCVTRYVTGTEETPECLNSSNFHTSFFASLVLGGNQCRQSESQTLINIVNSHRWSAQCPEYVALCASFILSVLQIYGQCIPQDKTLINHKSILMLNALDDLYEFLSKMKQSRWLVDDTNAKWKSCRDCDIRLMVLMQVNFLNRSTDKICSVCLQFASFCKPNIHNKLRTRLLAAMYPYSCSICLMKFSTEVDLQHHCAVDCPNIAVEGQSERVSSKLFGCFLCSLPFKTQGDLTLHIQSSLEHALRIEVATELALRNTVALDESCDLQLSDSSLMKSDLKKQSDYEENLIETATSSPDVSDAQYYCSPCSTFVQKCDIVDHERGLKHRLKYEGWISCLRKKSSEPCQEVKVSSENQLCTVSRSKVSVKDASTSMDFSEYGNIDQQGEKLLEEFFILEKDQVENRGEHYFCTKCSLHGKPFEMLSHKLGKNQCCNVDEQESEVLEEKLRILTTLMSILVVKQMYDLLKLISADAVPRLVDVLCYKKSQNLCNDKLSETHKLDVLKESDSDSVSTSEDSNKNNEEIVDDLPDDIMLTEASAPDDAVQLHKQHDGKESISDAAINTFTEVDVTRETEKYFLLDEIVEVVPGRYHCNLCNNDGNIKVMAGHALFGRSHFTMRYLGSQPISTLEKKLIIINFFRLAKIRNEAVVAHISHHQLNFAKTALQGRLASMNHFLPSTDSYNKHAEEVTGKQGLPSLDLPGTSKIREMDIPSSATSTSSLKHSGMRNESEERAPSGNIITIGDTASESLQQQMQTACAGRDLNDFEMECGTCGAVFEIFNDDVDFSLDMHIQTDPQHALAIAVPVERNSQSLSEINTAVKSTVEHPKPPILGQTSKESKVRLLDLTAKRERQAFEFKENKARVIDEVLKLEQKFVVMRENKYYCELCVVHVNSESQITHHILSPRHMSSRWIKRHTPEELRQKLLQLKSLLAFKYAGAAVCLAIDIIDKHQGKEGSSSESQTPKRVEPSSKENPKVFYCDACKIKMSIGSKPQHLRGKRHKANSSALLLNLKCSTNS